MSLFDPYPEPLHPRPSVTVELPDFDGATYRRDRDHARLGGQLRRVADALADGCWWTLAALAERTGDPEASVSARIRDLRKGKFGGYTVEHRNDGGGLWRYRLHAGPPPTPEPPETAVADPAYERDFAVVSPCPGCGTPVRRMGNVPIAGSGTELTFSGPWWCSACLKAKTAAALAALSAPK